MHWINKLYGLEEEAINSSTNRKENKYRLYSNYDLIDLCKGACKRHFRRNDILFGRVGSCLMTAP